MNERLLRDGCEAVARAGGLRGEMSSPTIKLWMAFVAHPTPRSWYRAHNASIVAAYLEHRDLAESESRPERFFFNVVLVRVLPNRYPLTGDVNDYLRDEHSFGRILDYAVIGARLHSLYDWSASELGHPGLRALVEDGAPSYAWPSSERHVWDAPPLSLPALALSAVTSPV
jgi:hypothetical protein